LQAPTAHARNDSRMSVSSAASAASGPARKESLLQAQPMATALHASISTDSVASSTGSVTGAATAADSAGRGSIFCAAAAAEQATEREENEAASTLLSLLTAPDRPTHVPRNSIQLPPVLMQVRLMTPRCRCADTPHTHAHCLRIIDVYRVFTVFSLTP